MIFSEYLHRIIFMTTYEPLYLYIGIIILLEIRRSIVKSMRLPYLGVRGYGISTVGFLSFQII